MKKIFLMLSIVALTVAAACSNEKKEDKTPGNTEKTGNRTIEGGSPAAYAAQWCDINSRITMAAEGEEKEAAKAKLKNFEEQLESEFGNDEAFMKAIEAEVEKCEDESEGR